MTDLITFSFKRDEDSILQEVQEYIASTYDAHYVGENDIQTIDVWQSLGTLDTTARDTAIKYLMRFGKKEGRNRKDLLKAMHYITLMLYVENTREAGETKTIGDLLDDYA